MHGPLQLGCLPFLASDECYEDAVSVVELCVVLILDISDNHIFLIDLGTWCPKGREWVTAIVNQGLNLNAPGGSPSISSPTAAT